ncbi:MAG: putative phosphoesterase [Labilithrix sp.]|nr:putative phosphoesterase [Labilithrix sp.]
MQRPARQTLPLGEDSHEALRIAVVADTHGRPHRAALPRIQETRPHHILHAGDIGGRSVLEDLARIAPVSAVRGNIDGRDPETPDARALVLTRGDQGLLTILLVHIAVSGPRLRADAARLARAEGASMVVCGHSHVPFIGRDRELSIFNPGSIGPRRFSLPIVFGLLEVQGKALSMKHIDVETGARWEP